MINYLAKPSQSVLLKESGNALEVWFKELAEKWHWDNEAIASEVQDFNKDAEYFEELSTTQQLNLLNFVCEPDYKFISIDNDLIEAVKENDASTNFEVDEDEFKLIYKKLKKHHVFKK
ncbi:MAG: hypothetical protein OQK09_12155 [Colwellia sp.]|nr:hypothetical protein [Colwellia sp.]MCW8864508.1 hypothetical protein [Colwellia sp.]MCW9082256.1 hypothetical protein [Colwellia sp.]